jgi:tetratricopeptide (TPR) repeat protein
MNCKHLARNKPDRQQHSLYSNNTLKFNYPLKQLGLLAIGLAPIILGACASLPGAVSDTQKNINGTATIRAEKRGNVKLNPIQQSMQSGIDAINAGDPLRANHEFNLAIARDLKNPALHAANGLAYHLRTRAGERDMFNMAETGYLVALEQRHDYKSTALQLAHLYLENKRYPQAQRAASYALKLDANNVEALYLLASASYTLGDVELALWSIEKVRALAPQDPLIARMVPAIYGSAGLTNEANAFVDAKQNSFNGQDSAMLKGRIEQWEVAYEIDGLVKPLDANTTATQTANDTTAGDPAIAIDANAPVVEPAQALIGKPDDMGPMAYSWFDCAQQLSANNTPPPPNAPGVVDETLIMPNLPSPCRGRAMPQMAIIDVVILRTNELNTSNNGINLLENLAVTISQASNKVTSAVGDAAGITTSTLTRNVGLGTATGSAIAYSLNIANVATQNTEVVARPSLLVLDRQPAQFFSGSNISIGVSGVAGAASSLTQVNVGISLSVTPTFINDKQMLLNVKAARTFFEPITGSSSTFSQSLQTSRNMVSAATKVNINETLVLSGLTEHEMINSSSGVPFLKDIPGVQYLFSKNTVQNYNKTVLILITPRRVVAYGEALDKVAELQNTDQSEPKLLQETRARALKELGGRWPSLYHAIRDMARKDRVFAAHTNDIVIDDWSLPPRVNKLLQETIDSLYL